jgi:hypothetical protein
MARVVRYALVAGLTVLLAASVGCQRKVSVETGTRVMCSYGHVISDDVKTVKVPVKQAVNEYIRTEVSTCPKHAQAEKLYQEAQSALAKGDMASAREKLKQVLALDKSFGSAAKQLADIDADKNPTADSGESKPAGAPGGAKSDDPAASPAGKLSVWTPATLTGFNGGRLVIDVFTVTRDYRPTSTGRIALMVIVAEQQRTAVGAGALMERMVKRPCPYDAATVNVKGRKAYFGTDNRRLATMAITEGPVMVAVQMATVKEGDPSSLKADLVEVMNQLP